MLFDSSTTHRTRSDRDGCVQNWHGSISVRLLQTEQRRIERFTSMIDSASSVASTESIFRIKKARRCADFVPMPGSFLNGSTSLLTGPAISMRTIRTCRESSSRQRDSPADLREPHPLYGYLH